MLSCAMGNPIVDFWWCNPNWQHNRKRLIDCGIGFRKDAFGGKNDKFSVVMDAGDDAMNPSHGMLHHDMIHTEPLWSHNNMLIQLKEDLVINGFKKIDGRGTNVHIGIHEFKRLRNTMVNTFCLNRKINHGDGISISIARHIWVDHCSMSNYDDGLVDGVNPSTYITIANSYFTRHSFVH